MPRPQRCRRICREPEFVAFHAEGGNCEEAVFLSLDEFEVLRLVDYEKLTHEQCAARMDISRTTVTEICESARHKLMESLITGRALYIMGGNVRLCEDSRREECGCHRSCPRHPKKSNN